ncbi:MAG TPA: fused MFS/spermidine synthase, partial [Pyrinomonadaceae bacterium]
MKVPTAEKRPSLVLRTIAICFVLSGATALVYEVLWARMLGLVFGATTIAICAVLTAFMGGLAIGSAVAGKFVNRLRRPLRAYAFIEAAIGLYALLVPTLFWAMDHVYAGIWQRFHPGFYAFAFARLLLAAIVLMIPTALMGATLPVLVSAVRQSGDSRATSVARLYGLNLLGAIIGAVLAGFFLLPSFGVSKSIWIAAITNLLIGIAAFVNSRRGERERIGISPLLDRNQLVAEEMKAGRAFWILCAFVSGVVTISMQVVWSRVLTMIIGSST